MLAYNERKISLQFTVDWLSFDITNLDVREQVEN
jgi:hypothetical protein